MIRPLRQIHRWTVPLLLAAILPALTMALRQRGPASPPESSPAAASVQLKQSTGTHRQIEVRLPASLPEVLAYWVPPGQMTVGTSAVLIGRPVGSLTVIDVPDELHEGQLLLYSLPLQQVVARQSLADGASP